jgi:predicted dithiol-disulfide oxidoreductase (DUF899 family)
VGRGTGPCREREGDCDEPSPDRYQEAWLAARKELLAKEKDLTRLRDELNAERRDLPMVEIAKDYIFDGPNGAVRLIDMFEGRRQLIIYHFMFDPGWEDGCPSCTAGTDELSPGFFAHLHTRDTSYAMVSRAPLAKLERWKAKKGWDVPWYSSFGTDFNRDFEVGPAAPDPGQDQDGETFCLSAFLQDGGEIYRSYFTQGRGVETLGPVWTLLDLTALGRQENWEDSPEGYPQTKPYQWWRRHDEYGR